MTNHSVEVVRVFDAKVELLWETWTREEYIKLWFGSDPLGIVQEVDIDLKVGGNFRIKFTDSDKSVHICKGVYLNINQNRNLKMSWEWESEPNQVSELNVDFVPLGDKTKIILTHGNLFFNSIHNYEYGWNGAFNKIERSIINAIQQK